MQKLCSKCFYIGGSQNDRELKLLGYRDQIRFTSLLLFCFVYTGLTKYYELFLARIGSVCEE